MSNPFDAARIAELLAVCNAANLNKDDEWWYDSKERLVWNHPDKEHGLVATNFVLPVEGKYVAAFQPSTVRALLLALSAERQRAEAAEQLAERRLKWLASAEAEFAARTQEVAAAQSVNAAALAYSDADAALTQYEDEASDPEYPDDLRLLAPETHERMYEDVKAKLASLRAALAAAQSQDVDRFCQVGRHSECMSATCSCTCHKTCSYSLSMG